MDRIIDDGIPASGSQEFARALRHYTRRFAKEQRISKLKAEEAFGSVVFGHNAFGLGFVGNENAEAK